MGSGRRLASLLRAICLGSIAFLAALNLGAQSADQDKPPSGLAASDWSGIRQAYERNRHAAFAVAGEYRARNFGQQWVTHFDGRGFTVVPDAAEWQWGLELKTYGFTGHQKMVTDAARVRAEKERVTYDRDGILEEWFVNDTRGLEQGFTLLRRPAGEGPLGFDLHVRGGLTPRVSADGRGIQFVDAVGNTALNFHGLKAWDATGRVLVARFEPRLGDGAPGLRYRVEEQGAQYPITIDPIAQQAYLKASNTQSDDRFAISLAISGDTVVVGAYQEDSSATGVNGNQADNGAIDSGAAYVFVRTGGVWTQQAYLKASNPNSLDYFGWSVAISGDTVVVGALQEASNATGVNGNQANNSAATAGAAYVFVRTAGVWTQQAYLKASNTNVLDQFGRSVAISADTVVVGANLEDSIGLQSGAAYVFVRTGGVWAQQAYLKASNPDSGDHFGDTVAISGDTVVVGAASERSNATGINGDQADNSAPQAGAAYVFVRSGITWSQQAYLKASNTNATDRFALSLAMSGDTVVVGADLEDSNTTGVNGDQTDNSALSAGAAYVFVRTGGVWTQQAYLKASNTDIGDQFGLSVGTSGDTVVVGAAGEDSNATGVNGNQADNSAADAGAAYVFVRTGGVWTQQAYLKASNPGIADGFGVPVAISGDTVLVGATGEDSNATGVNADQANNSATNAGAAYVFSLAFQADLAVTKFASASTIPAGENVTYTITVSNYGLDDAPSTELSDTLPSNTTFVSLSAPGGWTCTTPAAGVTGAINCTNPNLATGAWAEFTLVAMVNSTVAPGTVIENTATATSSATDPNPGSNSSTASFSVSNQASQTITFGALANKTFGDAPFAVSATATSGLTVSFGASGACTVLGNTVTLTGVGSCTITASQAGNANYNAAPGVPQAFSIGQASQTITFGALANQTFGDAPFAVSATATSGLTVSFGASGACTVLGSTVTLTGVGSCTITASQAGNANYSAAPDVPQAFSIGQANQTITFGALASKTFGDAPFAVSATATSGLTVSFGASGACTVLGSTVTLTGVGSCSITASQAGNANYNAAPDVPQVFSIGQANQTITFGALANKTFGDAPFAVSATATSGLTVSFGASGACTVLGNTVTLTGVGSCTITASQAGNANYSAALDVSQPFSIGAIVPTDTVGPMILSLLMTPNPIPVNTAMNLTAAVDDTSTGGSSIVTGEYRIDDGAYAPMSAGDGAFNSVLESVTAAIAAFTTAGVHEVCVRGTDIANNTGDESCILIAVYDPTSGFVTGGGWIDSPTGAYAASPTLTGKANFAFQSTYKKGANLPAGQTEFQFKAGDLNFKSASYEWLVVAGVRAQYKGEGTINGFGSYGFLLTAIDGKTVGGVTEADKFRIKIMDAVGNVVYDNKMGASDTSSDVTEIGGGSIVIHK